MPIDFQDVLDADAAGPFLGSGWLGKDITLTTAGSSSTIRGQLVFEDLANTQGSVLDTENGRRETKVGILITALAEAIVTADVQSQCSTVTSGGETWQCIRMIRKDDAMQYVEIRRDGKIATKRAMPRP